LFLAAIVLALAALSEAAATELVLKDGRAIRGKKVPLTGISEKPDFGNDPGPGAWVVFMLDDDLRRTYVGRWMIASERPEEGGELERFALKQPTARSGGEVRSVGPLFDITDFDEYGRRSLKMFMAVGKSAQKVGVVQAIREITPIYCKVEGTNYVWKMRIATSSIPLDQLKAILARAVNSKDIEQRKRLARFWMQCSRYEEANAVLEGLLRDFPDNEDVKKQLEPAVKRIRELSGNRMLDELKFRRDAGQHRLVLEMVQKFPSEGPAGDTIQAAAEIKREYEVAEAGRKKVLAQYDQVAAKIEDKTVQKRIAQVREELEKELNITTLPRMAAFREMFDDESLKPDEKLALAISGWLVDSKGATTKLSTALSLVQVRLAIEQYFAAGDKIARQKVLENIQSQEAATADFTARLLANMRPPLATDPPEDPNQPYDLEVQGLSNAPPVRYLVQLPPEYDPYRRYPTVVALHGEGSTPQMQVGWWAGEVGKSGMRSGQATRQGYIVVAPAWGAEHQRQYQFSAREHNAVLAALRDAKQRFSIDTDRIFLAGHSMGGDAAWDIGLSHPDLWAGVIPVGAKGDRYIHHYWENAKLVPFYFVCGELDAPHGIAANERDWNRYLSGTGYNVTVVEYQGRGHEHFLEEILRIFEFMAKQRRNPFPREFDVKTLRPWDNSFWWVEMSGFPEKTMVDPEEFAGRKGIRPMETKARIMAGGNTINVQTGASRVTVWLAPDMLDLGRRLSIQIRGRQLNAAPIVPEMKTILDDVRTRADRQHPFWAKVESPGGTGEKEK
jgi:pimeloyl-ACP methyl ester carboxylesterase